MPVENNPKCSYCKKKNIPCVSNVWADNLATKGCVACADHQPKPLYCGLRNATRLTLHGPARQCPIWLWETSQGLPTTCGNRGNSGYNERRVLVNHMKKYHNMNSQQLDQYRETYRAQLDAAYNALVANG
ncbi:hypothetical protein MNV49_005938 [Pseudohyphozyma bogoriensis]|nr:hypothetical protein MNV49_005938 [Pseudohyphozyma bogoriensis]